MRINMGRGGFRLGSFWDPKFKTVVWNKSVMALETHDFYSHSKNVLLNKGSSHDILIFHLLIFHL